ncbi:MAG: AprI/Inh family metalloprotease inhibitor, partial [Bosea sp. (in: a-proteobacteria)]
PILNKAVSWSVGDDGFVRLLDAEAKPVLSFEDDAAALKLKASADGTDYQFDSLGRPRRFVARVAAASPPRIAFDPAKAPPRDSIPGLYGMFRYGGQEVCRISLGTNPGAADGRFLTDYPTRCRDKGLQVFDAVAWRYSGGKVHLIARRGHEMVLVSTAEGEWQKDPPGGSELILRRVKN